MLRNFHLLAALFVAGCATIQQPQSPSHGATLAGDLATSLAPCGPISAGEIGMDYAQHNAADLGSALQRNRLAASGGDVEAQLYLGRAYYFGWGVAPDYGEAVAWLRRAAAQGSADAMTSLGYLYDGGCGVSPDPLRRSHGFSKPLNADSRTRKTSSVTPTMSDTA